MLYQRHTFTLPAANKETSQVQWDLAFLSSDEFTNKYGVNPQDASENLAKYGTLLPMELTVHGGDLSES